MLAETLDATASAHRMLMARTIPSSLLSATAKIESRLRNNRQNTLGISTDIHQKIEISLHDMAPLK